MRAGLTAVPLDPQWPGTDVWSATEFVHAKLICAGASKMDGIEQTRGDWDTEVVSMSHPSKISAHRNPPEKRFHARRPASSICLGSSK